MNENIEIKKLNKNEIKEFIELIQVFEGVFEMENFNMPEKEYLIELLKKEDFFVFVAIHENKVIGGLTSYTLPAYYLKSSYVYIYDLAVNTKFQRKGIGKKLIAKINDYCKELGIEEVFVQADLEDDYAIDFYRKTGGIEVSVVHFNYPLQNK